MPDSYLPFPSTKKRRQTSRIITVEVGRRSAWLRGYGLARVLDEIGSPRMWCPRQKCLTVPVDRVDDVLAIVEFRDRRMVELTPVDR